MKSSAETTAAATSRRRFIAWAGTVVTARFPAVLTAVLASVYPALLLAQTDQSASGAKESPLLTAAKKAQEVIDKEEKAEQEAAMKHIAANTNREDMIRIPMRDGLRLSATLIFPKNRQNLPTILVFNPYNTERMIKDEISHIRLFTDNGYAIAFVNSRGRYFSEGTYTFLGGSGNDGYDTIDWLSKQSWSNGKVGTIGCSSSAEEQHKMNAMQHPALAAAVPMGSGAGIGKVGPYNEMGNFYRGGVIQNVWFAWYPSHGYKYKPSFPAGLTRTDMLRLSQLWNLEPELKAKTNLLDKAIWTLPIKDVLTAIDAAPSDLDQFVTWQPNDPRWKLVEFGGEGDPSGAPALYINSWYDLSIGPNLAMYEYQSKNAANETARNNVFMIIGPTLHCGQGSEREHTYVGERDVGDARFDYNGFILRWYDHWLKGVDNGVTKEPKVHAYLMGANAWRSYDRWPPASRPITYYLDSDGDANTRNGNGRLTLTRPGTETVDRYTYDPREPTPTVGGQVCCFAAAQGGSFDQSAVEQRPDVLVYTSSELTKPLEVTGPINVTLYLSSDVTDTDLMVKLIDVGPDGLGFNLDEGVMRVRWREGFDKPVFMTPNAVYKVDFPPLVTSNRFGAGHRIRIAVSSSSFPEFERNLNTGGRNFDEKDGIVAHNSIHHAAAYPSHIVLPVVRASASSARISP